MYEARLKTKLGYKQRQNSVFEGLFLNKNIWEKGVPTTSRHQNTLLEKLNIITK